MPNLTAQQMLAQLPVRMAVGGDVTDEQIRNYFATNAGASDAQIAQAMDQYGVTSSRLAAATGYDQGEVARRYDAATSAFSPAGASTSTASTPSTSVFSSAALTDSSASAPSTSTASAIPLLAPVSDGLKRVLAAGNTKEQYLKNISTYVLTQTNPYQALNDITASGVSRADQEEALGKKYVDDYFTIDYNQGEKAPGLVATNFDSPLKKAWVARDPRGGQEALNARIRELAQQYKGNPEKLRELYMDYGASIADVQNAGVDPSVLLNFKEVICPPGYSKNAAGVCELNPCPPGYSRNAAGACVLKEKEPPPFPPPTTYTPTTVYQPIAAPPPIYGAGQPALDVAFRNSAPRTWDPRYGYTYTPAAKLLPATGAGMSWTPPSVTSRPRDLLNIPLPIDTGKPYKDLTPEEKANLRLSSSQYFARDKAAAQLAALPGGRFSGMQAPVAPPLDPNAPVDPYGVKATEFRFYAPRVAAEGGEIKKSEGTADPSARAMLNNLDSEAPVKRNLPKEAQDARRARVGLPPAVPQDYSGRDLTGELLNVASLATAPVPVLGDIAGLAADARMYQMHPEERTMGNYALSALGVLPFVPSVSAVKTVGKGVKTAAEGLAKQGKNVIEITNPIGPWKAFQAQKDGQTVATVRKVGDQWLLTDRVGGSPFESGFLKNAKTNNKGFTNKGEAIAFIKSHYTGSDIAKADGVKTAAEELSDLGTYYHGTNKNILDSAGNLNFKTGQRGAVFLTPDPNFAAKYALNDTQLLPSDIDRMVTQGTPAKEGASIYPVTPNVLNTFDINNKDHLAKLKSVVTVGGAQKARWKPIQEFIGQKIREENPWVAVERLLPDIKTAGFDSAFIEEMGRRNLAVFDPKNVESALAAKALPVSVVQTDTPEFKNFFGESKVVDAEGKPLPVYHGTDSDFTEFKKGKNINFDNAQRLLGFFFAKDQAYAAQYGSKVMPVYLSIKNPFKAPASKIDALENTSDRNANKWVKSLKDKGFDGIQFGEGATTEYVAFQPTQIKSATSNSGTFDSSTPDITKADGGLIQKYATGNEVSSNTKDLIAQMNRVGDMPNTPTPNAPTPNAPLAKEQTDSASMLDNLIRAYEQNISKPAVGSVIDMTLGLGDLGQMGAKYLANRAGIKTDPFVSTAERAHAAAGTTGYDPYTIGGIATNLLPFARGEQVVGGAAKTFASMFPNLGREALSYAGGEAGAAAARELLPDSTAAQFVASLAGSVAGGVGGSPTMSNMAVKNEGGNWLKGDIAYRLKPLKQYQHEGGQNYSPRPDPLNAFVDKQLTDYVQNKMGTPTDTLRIIADKYAEERPALLAAAQAKIDALYAKGDRIARERGVPRESLTQHRQDEIAAEKAKALIEARQPLHRDNIGISVSVSNSEREAAGLPVEGYGVSEAARRYENLADVMIINRPARDWQKGYMSLGQPSRIMKNLEENPWLKKVSPETPVYEMQYDTDRLGFDHLIDELRNAVNPDSGLPKELLINPKDLPKITMEQAVNRVADINAWRSVNRREANFALANNPATFVHKQYPDGMKWVQIKRPDDLPEGWTVDEVGKTISPEGKYAKDPRETAVSDALKYEGDTMINCVGGYCDRVLGGKSEIFSLRNDEGQPFATIEVQPSDIITPEKRKAEIERFMQGMRNEGRSEEEARKRVMRIYPESETLPLINQIKGIDNGVVEEKYWPLVQDFINSGAWSKVRENTNAGLLEIDVDSDLAKSLTQKGIAFPAYATQQEITNLLKQAQVGVYSDWRQSGKIIRAEPLPEEFAGGGAVRGYEQGGPVQKYATGNEVSSNTKDLIAQMNRVGARPNTPTPDPVKTESASMLESLSRAIPTDPNQQAAWDKYRTQTQSDKQDLLDRLDAATSLERYTYDQLGMEPGLNRATAFPWAGSKETGDLQLAFPGLLYDAINLGNASGATMQGVPVSKDEAVAAAMNMIGMNAPVGIATAAAAGPGEVVLGSFGSAIKEFPQLKKLAPYLTDEEKALFDNPQWRKQSDNTLNIYKELPPVREMATVARAGGAKKGWYKDSYDAIQNIFENSEYPDDPERFTALLAALSPQTSVESNLRNALATWKNWLAAGRPQDPDKILKVMGDSVEGNKGIESVLGAWRNNSFRALTSPDAKQMLGTTGLSGPKVQSFFRNLAGDFDEVTNDAWMAKLSSINQSLFGGQNRASFADKFGNVGIKGPGYLAQNAKQRQAAELLGWNPAEVQETGWSFGKTLSDLAGQPNYVIKSMENSGIAVPEMYRGLPVQTAESALRGGYLTDEAIGGTPAFGDLMHVPEYRDLLTGAGYSLPERSTTVKQYTSPYDRISTAPSDLAKTQEGRDLIMASRRIDKMQRRSDAYRAIDMAKELMTKALTDSDRRSAAQRLNQASKMLQRSTSELPMVDIDPAYRGFLGN